MAYKVIILYRLYMPSYFLGTFTEYPYSSAILNIMLILDRNHIYLYSTPNSVFRKLPTMVYQNGKSSFWQCQG